MKKLKEFIVVVLFHFIFFILLVGTLSVPYMLAFAGSEKVFDKVVELAIYIGIGYIFFLLLK